MSDGNETISDSELSGKIPQNIAFGTSTWTYPGWKGSVYKLEYETDKAFRRDSLREYAQFPLFRTVGIDSTFYQPASLELLKSYSSQVPSEFKWVSKVWERLTIPEFPRHKRYGSLAGQRNQDFLSSEIFLKALAPLQEPAVINHLGPVVLQFPFIKQSSMGFDEFGDCLSRLLSSLSNSPFSCAVEIRNPDYLVTEYFKLLNTYNAAHCFNHWQ